MTVKEETEYVGTYMLEMDHSIIYIFTPLVTFISLVNVHTVRHYQMCRTFFFNGLQPPWQKKKANLLIQKNGILSLFLVGHFGQI